MNRVKRLGITSNVRLNVLINPTKRQVKKHLHSKLFSLRWRE
ncbi:MAG: hypothetical protein ACO3JG_15750 [Luteolibacter sp.]